MSRETGYIVLIILWLAYFAIHSVMASLAFKRKIQRLFPGIMPWYRIIFNSASIVLIFPPLAWMFAIRGEWLWEWQGIWAYLANALAIAALFGIGWSMRSYDGSEFLGIRQARDGRESITDDETFKLSTLHRYVRHPWYALSLVLIWTRDMDAALLITALSVSLYFVIGSRLEERKLITYHGELYRRYMQRVPALVPLPWKWLSRAEARQLTTREKDK
jgi:protein-S-isoprenylcysteine O-methyltransferase Ste14